MDGTEAHIARLKRQYRIMQINMKAYRRETHNVLRKQTAVMASLTSDKREAELEYRVITSSQNEKRRKEAETTLHGIAISERQTLQDIETEKGRIADLERRIMKTERDLRGRGRCLRDLPLGANQTKEEVELQQAKSLLQNRLHAVQVSLNGVVSDNRSHREEIKHLLLSRDAFSKSYRELAARLANHQRMEGAIVEQATRYYAKRDYVNTELARLLESEQKEQNRYNADFSALTRSVDHAQSLQALLWAKIHAKTAMENDNMQDDPEKTAEELDAHREALRRIRGVLEKCYLMGIFEDPRAEKTVYLPPASTVPATDPEPVQSTTPEPRRSDATCGKAVTSCCFPGARDATDSYDTMQGAPASDAGSVAGSEPTSAPDSGAYSLKDQLRHLAPPQSSEVALLGIEVASLPDLYHAFEEDNTALYNYISKLNSELESCQLQLQKLEEDSERKKCLDSSASEEHDSSMGRLQTGYEEAVDALEASKLFLDSQQLEMTSLCRDVRMVIELMGRWGSPLLSLSDNYSVNELNVLTYLAMLKRSASQLPRGHGASRSRHISGRSGGPSEGYGSSVDDPRPSSGGVAGVAGGGGRPTSAAASDAPGQPGSEDSRPVSCGLPTLTVCGAGQLASSVTSASPTAAVQMLEPGAGRPGKSKRPSSSLVPAVDGGRRKSNTRLDDESTVSAAPVPEQLDEDDEDDDAESYSVDDMWSTAKSDT